MADAIDERDKIIQKKNKFDHHLHVNLTNSTKAVGIFTMLIPMVKMEFNDLESIPNSNEEMTYFTFPI